MWSMSTVVQVDSDKVIVTKFERRKNRSALPRFIFHSAFRSQTEACQVKENRTKLNSDLKQDPFSLFIQVVSEFRSWRIPIFSQVLCHLCHTRTRMGANPCHFFLLLLFVFVLDNNLNSSLKLLVLLFIPSCLMRASLLSFLRFQVLHRIGLFPSTCAYGVSAPRCYLPAVQPQTHSGALHAHS